MNLQFLNSGRYLAHAALASLLVLTLSARADMIELTNGDHYRGTVISMTQSNVEFMSEIQGRVKLPRDKIAQINLHEVVAKPVVAATNPAAPAAPVVGTALILSGAPKAPAGQADAVVQQMRQQGVDPKLIDQVQQQIFAKSSPEASQKFNDMMSGLTSGSISVQDIRKQAQGSIDQINAAKKEFGPEAGEMLDSYLVILQKFVNDAGDGSVPSATPSAPVATK